MPFLKKLKEIWSSLSSYEDHFEITETEGIIVARFDCVFSEQEFDVQEKRLHKFLEPKNDIRLLLDVSKIQDEFFMASNRLVCLLSSYLPKKKMWIVILTTHVTQENLCYMGIRSDSEEEWKAQGGPLIHTERELAIKALKAIF